MQAAPVPDDLDRLGRQVELPAVLGGGRAGVAGDVDGEHAQVDRFALEGATVVEAGEQQEVLDEVLHAHRLGLDPRQGVHDPLGHGLALPAGELGVAADRGERRAQLVAGVGDELPHPRLRGLPCPQRAVDVVEHAVEGQADLTDLGARVDVLHALGERDVPGAQLELGDPTRGAGDPFERLQGPAHEVGPAQPDADEADEARADDDERDAVERRVDRLDGDAGDRRPTVLGAHRDEAVGADVLSEVDRPRPGADAGLGEIGDLARVETVVLAGRVDGVVERCAALVGGDGPVAEHEVQDGVAAACGRSATGAADGDRGLGAVDRADEALRGLLQVLVDLLGEVLPGGEARQRARHRRDGEEEEEDRGDELGPQGPRGRAAKGGHGAGLRTYPAPRRVWIIGSRPASIFLRRYEM